MLLSSELPSWGVKHMPITSRSPFNVRVRDAITVWLRMRPNRPWSRPKEKTAAADFFHPQPAAQLQVEIDRVHVLGVEFQSRRENVQVQPQSLEQEVRVPALMRAEAGVVVFPYFRRGNEVSLLTQIVGQAHADEPPLFDVVLFLGTQD